MAAAMIAGRARFYQLIADALREATELASKEFALFRARTRGKHLPA